MFSGFDRGTSSYDKSTWNYEEGGNLTGTAAAAIAAGDGPATADNATKRQLQRPRPLATGKGHTAGGPVGAKASGAPAAPALPPNTAYDLSLEHPRCVFQLLKKQYSRYTPEMVRAHHWHPQGSIPQGSRTCSPPSAKTAT